MQRAAMVSKIVFEYILYYTDLLLDSMGKNQNFNYFNSYYLYNKRLIEL